jgi:hypothetical protein
MVKTSAEDLRGLSGLDGWLWPRTAWQWTEVKGSGRVLNLLRREGKRDVFVIEFGRGRVRGWLAPKAYRTSERIRVVACVLYFVLVGPLSVPADRYLSTCRIINHTSSTTTTIFYLKPRHVQSTQSLKKTHFATRSVFA